MTDSIQRRAEQELQKMRNLDRIHARAHDEHVRRFRATEELLRELFRDEHTIPLPIIRRALLAHQNDMPWNISEKDQSLRGIVTEARRSLDIESYAIARRLMPFRWKEYAPSIGAGTLWSTLPDAITLWRWLREERIRDEEQQAMT